MTDTADSGETEETETTMNAIIPRETVESVYANRQAALRLYATAFEKIAAAAEAIGEADAMARRFGGENNYSVHDSPEVRAFHSAVQLPDAERYMNTARKLTNVAAWSFIMNKTNLEKLMDKQAKDELRAQFAYVPDRVDRKGQLITDDEAAKALPEFEIGTVYATIERYMAEADHIFRRGIANVFSKLDRRFRSHDGFKIGSRMILTHAFNSNTGSLSWGSIRDQLIDVERVFAILDGETDGTFSTGMNALDEDRKTWGPHQSETETRYFKIRGFKNGNAHLWFTRDDLLEKVNKLLGEYYGEVIGDGQTQEADPFADVKHVPAKYFGFYPTPDAAARQLMDGTGSWRSQAVYKLQPADKPQLRFLEPSAGTGNLARRCISSIECFKGWSGYNDPERMAKWRTEYRFDNLVDVVELQSHLAAQLEAEGIYNRVYPVDFLQLTPQVTGLYDRIVMNPPFDRERDIDHVMHAYKFLKPGGYLHAIMSAGTEFRGTKKATAFREFVKKINGTFEDLPANSFAEVGTNVNTMIVRFTKPAA